MISTPPTPPDHPAPLERTLVRTIHFHEVDAMGVMWFGNYCRLIDEAGAHVRAKYGLSYDDFRQAGVMAPVKRLDIDYKLPLRVGEEVRIVARIPWNEALRIDTECTIFKQDGQVAATGHIVQLLVEAPTMALLLVEPPFIRTIRERWRRGELTAC